MSKPRAKISFKMLFFSHVLSKLLTRGQEARMKRITLDSSISIAINEVAIFYYKNNNFIYSFRVVRIMDFE